MKLGFVGTGEITAAMVTGFCTAPHRLDRIYLSPRNAEKAAALAERFPEVEVAPDNQAVVDQADWVVLAVRPQVAREVVAPLDFRVGQGVVSVVADLPLVTVAELVAPAEALAQAVPLPPVARHLGPIAICPPCEPVAELFGRIGTAVEVESAGQIDAFWSATALMAPYYALLGRSADWLSQQGVPRQAADRYVGAMFNALSVTALEASTAGFDGLTAASKTAGGLNEQALQALNEDGWYDDVSRTLDAVLARLRAPSAVAPDRA